VRDLILAQHRSWAPNLHKRASQRLLTIGIREGIVAAASRGSRMPLRASYFVHSISRPDSREIAWLGHFPCDCSIACAHASSCEPAVRVVRSSRKVASFDGDDAQISGIVDSGSVAEHHRPLRAPRFARAGLQLALVRNADSLARKPLLHRIR